MKAKEMLFYTKNKQELVPAGDPRARFQAFTEGQEIPDSEAKKLVEQKQAPTPQRKVVESAPNKAQATGKE